MTDPTPRAATAPTAPHLFSASQITSYRECPRKWAWRYIAGIKTDQDPSARLGTEVDDEQIQPYLRDGRPFDYSKPAITKKTKTGKIVHLTPSGYVAESMRRFLPQPGTVEIQHHFVLPSPTWIAPGVHVGFGFQGYADIWAKDSSALPGCAGGVPGVGDTKTSTDIGQWAKTEKDLLVDPQAQLYALAAMYETGARTVDLDWIYGQTRDARKAKQVIVRVESPHVEEQFQAINATALEMWKAKKAGVNPLDLPAEVDACEAFNGCPYRAKCNLSPTQIRQAHAAKAARYAKPQSFVVEGEHTMSAQDMLAVLRAKKAAQAGQAAPSVPAPAATAAPMQAPAPPSSPPVPAPANVAPPTSVTSPETGLPAQLPAWAMEMKPFTGHVPGLGGGAPPVGINPPDKNLPPAPPVNVAPAPAADAPAKRHRRTKAEMEAARAAETADEPIPYVPAAPIAVEFTVGPFKATITGLSGDALTEAVIATHATLTELAGAL